MKCTEDNSTFLINEMRQLSQDIKSHTALLSSQLDQCSSGLLNQWELFLIQYDTVVTGVIASLRIKLNQFLEEYLTVWKVQQQMKIVGADGIESEILHIDQVQIYFESVFQEILNILEQLKHSERKLATVLPNLKDESGSNNNENGKTGLRKLINSVVHLLWNFIRETFVVTEQPPMLFKGSKLAGLKGNKSGGNVSSACLLVGPAVLPFVNETDVKMMFISEGQARRIYFEGENALWDFVGAEDHVEIDGNIIGCEKGVINITQETDRLVVALDKGTCDKLIMKTRKSELAKVKVDFEAKSCLLYTVSVDICGFKTQIWTTSMPLCIATHSIRQKGLEVGVASIVRDYVTSHVNRIPFEIPHPEFITWTELSQVIQCLFRKYFKDDDIQLTDENLECIRQKAVSAIKSYNTDNDNNNKIESTLSENLPWDSLKSPSFETLLPSISKHSFWDWLFGSFYLLKDSRNQGQMMEMWKQGLILGWIGKEDAEKKLKGEPPETFLLRFPDRFVGAISIVFTCKAGKIHHLRPCLYDEFRNKTLVNKIKEFVNLKYIYPFHPYLKEEILKDFETVDKFPTDFIPSSF